MVNILPHLIIISSQIIYITTTTTDNSLSPSIKWPKNGTIMVSNFCLIFKRSCSKQKTDFFSPPNIIIFFTVHKLDAWGLNLNSDLTLKDCLCGSVKLAKNADSDKYVCSGYVIGKAVIIFAVDMSSSVYSFELICAY